MGVRKYGLGIVLGLFFLSPYPMAGIAQADNFLVIKNSSLQFAQVEKTRDLESYKDIQDYKRLRRELNAEREILNTRDRLFEEYYGNEFNPEDGRALSPLERVILFDGSLDWLRGRNVEEKNIPITPAPKPPEIPDPKKPNIIPRDRPNTCPNGVELPDFCDEIDPGTLRYRLLCSCEE